jgi:pimeloyl-ACP methyl ester carboxylesterase
MPLIHHVVTGQGRPPIVFVHGFGCTLSDWDAQVAHLSPRHQTVAVDLRGHGASPGSPDECSILQFGADVAEFMLALALPPAILVGHSMGCRVAVEAALQVRARVAGVVLVDGSQFASTMNDTLKKTFATPDGYPTLILEPAGNKLTTKSDPAVAASVIERAGRLPRAIGEKVLLDAVRYDSDRPSRSLGSLHVPLTRNIDRRARGPCIKRPVVAARIETCATGNLASRRMR